MPENPIWLLHHIIRFIFGSSSLGFHLYADRYNEKGSGRYISGAYIRRCINVNKACSLIMSWFIHSIYFTSPPNRNPVMIKLWVGAVCVLHCPLCWNIQFSMMLRFRLIVALHHQRGWLGIRGADLSFDWVRRSDTPRLIWQRKLSGDGFSAVGVMSSELCERDRVWVWLEVLDRSGRESGCQAWAPGGVTGTEWRKTALRLWITSAWVSLTLPRESRDPAAPGAEPDSWSRGAMKSAGGGGGHEPSSSSSSSLCPRDGAAKLCLSAMSGGRSLVVLINSLVVLRCRVGVPCGVGVLLPLRSPSLEDLVVGGPGMAAGMLAIPLLMEDVRRTGVGGLLGSEPRRKEALPCPEVVPKPRNT